MNPLKDISRLGRLLWSLTIMGVLLTVFFLVRTAISGYKFWGGSVDFTVTGQFGDFVGGVIGTIFSFIGTVLVYVNFCQQDERRFESSFFEMLHLHRENVAEMQYTKFDPNTSEMRTAHNRKVFRIIFTEFTDCLHEINRFRPKSPDDVYLPAYRDKLMKRIINKDIDFKELAMIDIAYSIVFYGVGEEGKDLLINKLKKQYDNDLIERIILPVRLKPKRKNREQWKLWNDEANNISHAGLLGSSLYAKYYNGHQHRLEHYFQHLFLACRYLSQEKNLPAQRIGYYGEMLQAQLSVFEQALLFIHSISSLGREWELCPDIKQTASKTDLEKSGLITRFNLIRDVSDFSGLDAMKYYPKVKYSVNNFI